MVGGGAYVAGKHAARNQQREADQSAQIADLQDAQYAAPPPQYAPAPPQYAPPPPAPAPAPPAAAASAVDPITALTQLKALLDSGVLTQAEFDAQKQRVLEGS
jgi:hypothetical protein